MATPRPLAVHDRGVDYTSLPSTLSNLLDSGGRFVLRYSAGVGNTVPATQFKLCGINELRSTVAAGVDVAANSEWYESRITEGTVAGKADGAADLAFWKARGLAKGASIYVSWDEGQPNTSKHASVAAYLRGYQSSLAGYYHADLYAGDVAIAAMLKLGVIRYGWRAMSDSWSGNGSFYQPGSRWQAVAAAVAAKSPAHIWQNGNRWWNNRADENVILRLPIGSHLESLTNPTPAPTPPEDDMPIRTSLSHTKPQTLPLGTDVAVNWDQENTDPKNAHQAGNYPGYIAPVSSYADGTVELYIDGLADTDVVKVVLEMNEWKNDKPVSPSRETLAKVCATPDGVELNVPFSKYLTKGTHTYVRVTVTPAAGDTAPRKSAPVLASGTWRVRQDQGA